MISESTFNNSNLIKHSSITVNPLYIPSAHYGEGGAEVALIEEISSYDTSQSSCVTLVAALMDDACFICREDADALMRILFCVALQHSERSGTCAF